MSAAIAGSSIESEPDGPPLIESQSVRILIVATLVSAPLMILAILAPPAVRPVWDNLHWSVSAIGAAIAAAWSVRGATGRARVIRRWGALALGLWMLATVIWALMNLIATASVPSIVDVLVISIAVPGARIIVATVHGRLSAAEEAAVYLDGALGLVLIGSVVVFVFGPTTVVLSTAPSIAAMIYPTIFLGVAGSGLVAVFAVGYPIAPRGPFALLGGCALIGLAYLGWLGPVVTLSDPGPLSSILFTAGTLVSGYGVATWRSARSTNARYLAFARSTTRIIGPLIGTLLFVVILLPAPESIDGALHILVFGGAILLIFRQGLIVRERTAMLATVTELTLSNERLVRQLRRELEERAGNESRSIEAARADAVGSLSASVGHEVNNPLTGVLGYAELVLAELPTDHPSRRDVETIREEALRARGTLRAARLCQPRSAADRANGPRGGAPPKLDRTTIRIGGYLHDIGKIAIADRILLKPGPLTPDEYVEMQRHADIGGDIVSTHEAMSEIARIVRHHHEWHDGGGFPAKLVADDIPIGARIISVADALSAMTTDRPYRKAMPLDQAWAEITKHSGGQFDPMIVDLYGTLIGTDIKDAEPGTTGTTISFHRHDPTPADGLEQTASTL